MSGHTPGPWHARLAVRSSDNQATAYEIAVDTYADVVCTPSRWPRVVATIEFGKSGAKRGMSPRWHPSAADHANARLIAAAPQLLTYVQKEAAECQHCLGTGYYTQSNGTERCEWCADLRALIDLATKEPA